MRATLLSSILALGLLGAAGCTASAQTTRQAGPSAPQASAQGQAGTAPQPAMTCPMAIPGADIKVEDTPEGVAITFTTPGEGGDVEALRRGVQQMADLGSPCWRPGMMARRPGAMRGTGGAGMAGATGLQRSASADVRVEDVPGGARLLLAAADPARVDTLRAQARVRAEHMRLGQQMMMMNCPMMQGGQCPMLEGGECPAMQPRGQAPSGSQGP